MDKPLLIALGLSMACHLIALGVQWLRFGGHPSRLRLHDLEVVYQYEIAERDLRALRQAAKLQAPSSTSSGSPGLSPSIRVPQRPVMEPPVAQQDLQPWRSAVIDLTNLMQAAQGNPVLLSYFSAIREQIQQTANRETWLAGSQAQGLVYVSFALSADGQVRQVSVVRERSVKSSVLQDIAERIIEAAGPFPPFPPSMAEPSKLIVVPLEFSLGTGLARPEAEVLE